MKAWFPSGLPSAYHGNYISGPSALVFNIIAFHADVAATQHP
jgi:hypothetical protein